MKETIIKVSQLAIALLVGGLAMTVYVQHRELSTYAHLIDPTDGKPSPPPRPMSTPPIPSSIFTPPPYVGPGAH